MIETLRSTLDVFVDRSPGDLIGAVMIALTLALAMTGLYALRRKNTGEPMIVLIVLMLCANVASMALAAGYLAKTWKAEKPIPKENTPSTAWWPPPGGIPPEGPVHKGLRGGPPGGRGPVQFRDHGHVDPQVGQVFAVADADKDGRVTPEEAAQFIRAADPNGKGSIDVRDFYSAVRERLAVPTGPPRTADPDESR